MFEKHREAVPKKRPSLFRELVATHDLRVSSWGGERAFAFVINAVVPPIIADNPTARWSMLPLRS